jgi:PAS domain S-box-containing protein
MSEHTVSGRLGEVAERLQHVLAASGAAATWEWQIADRRIVGDAGFAMLFGLQPEQAAAGVLPQVFFSIIHPQDRDRIRLAVGGMLRGAEVLSKEYRIVGGDGAIRWVHARGRCQYDEQDRPTRFSGVLVDITAQKHLEEQLRIAQTAGGVGTFEHIEGFGTVAVSAQFCRLLGLHPAADLPVTTINAVVHPHDPPVIDLAALSEPGSARSAELRIVRPDTGESRWLMRRGECLRDTEAPGTRFSGVVYDITDAKRIEGELRTLNETLETKVEERTRERDRIWRFSRDLLGVADMEWCWRSINPAWQALLGWNDADLLGKTFAWLEHPDDLAFFRAGLARLAEGEKTLAFENRLRHRDGSYRWLSWTAVPEADLLYCVGRDVTTEKMAAEALRQAEDKLRQSQKMEAVGQLTGGLAHDFNNLLTGITGSLELLQLRLAQGRLQEVDRYVGAAQGAAKRAAALTHRLLAFSRRQTLDPKPTDLNRLVAGMEELVRRTVGPAITLTVLAKGGPWHTLVDPNQLENALLNLCINARDAMPDGGRLTIETRETLIDPRTALEHDLSPGQYLALSVSDTGTGMTPAVRARAFDPFFTTKPIGQGTGLGLSMIYGFARQSCGEVSIDSEVGRGTTVSIWLPRHHGAREDAQSAGDAAARSEARQGETVLVVDDEATVRMFLADVLEELGYVPIEAADGAAGVEVLNSDARIDLLITDVGLPGGMNGRQVADAGRAVRPGLKVLFITGYAQNAALSHFELDPGMHVLTKPFSIEVLTSRIKEIIAAP